jgi:hypothetical protein
MGPSSAYRHLAAFLREAPEPQSIHFGSAPLAQEYRGYTSGSTRNPSTTNTDPIERLHTVSFKKNTRVAKAFTETTVVVVGEKSR